MIIDFLITLITIILGAIASLLPTWQLWPADFLNGLIYFSGMMAKLNFIFPVDTLFAALRVLADFEALYFTVWLAMMVVSFFRGGKGVEA
jgi:hypothetical protein